MEKTTTTKKCPKCKNTKQTTEFHRNRTTQDGLAWSCKSCCHADMVRYYSRNRDEQLKASRRWRRLNKERMRAAHRRWREMNRDYVNARSREWNAANKKKRADISAKYKADNRQKSAMLASRRRATRLKAQPKWLTLEQLSEIAGFYEAANGFRRLAGVELHVDHIVPLQGKTVCGLHVPWNLQLLTADENLKKGNRTNEQ